MKELILNQIVTPSFRIESNCEIPNPSNTKALVGAK